MAYRVIISPRAESEFEKQYLYLREHSKIGADHWAQEVEKALGGLSETPDSHGVAPENSDHAAEVRQAIFTTRGLRYRILFTIRGNQVLVLTLRGMGQDLASFDDLGMESVPVPRNSFDCNRSRRLRLGVKLLSR